MKIVAAGECCLDHYEGEPEPRLGGITFNFAMHAARAFPDAEIHLLSTVGEDARTAFTARLDAAGIRHDLTPADSTPSIGIRLDDHGERRFFDYDPGGLLDWQVSESQCETIRSSDLVVLTRYQEIAPLFQRLVRLPTEGRRIVDFADASGTPVSDLDALIEDRGFADVCIFGLSPSEHALRDHLHSIARDHSGLFVITLASGGAVAIQQEQIYHQPAFPVAQVIDTTGAGDCFAAHFLSRWCASDDVADALAAGCLAASQIIQHRGAS
ncbi:MAG: carbohydrate kinase family protein [Proteobacteria bacterium]|jgi:sugar/nucleoside kinase (ribokinase family)|nr:carbohydrate kinase family protein [Pseudomonadota bacterium]MDA1302528.1 carbohydrate kinase family protein [Pseudomonadota bacterium]